MNVPEHVSGRRFGDQFVPSGAAVESGDARGFPAYRAAIHRRASKDDGVEVHDMRADDQRDGKVTACLE